MPRIVDFHAHMMTVEIKPPEPVIKCDYCDYTTLDSANMSRHIDTVHIKARSYLCDDCGASYNRSDALKKHKVSEHSGLPKPPRAPRGPRNKGNRPPLDKSEEKRYLCKFCDRPFKSASNRKKHEERVHQKLKKYACNHCEYKASNNDYLRNHLLKTHNIVLEKYIHLKEQKRLKQERLDREAMEKKVKKERKQTTFASLPENYVNYSERASAKKKQELFMSGVLPHELQQQQQQQIQEPQHQMIMVSSEIGSPVYQEQVQVNVQVPGVDVTQYTVQVQQGGALDMSGTNG